ncbi:hypothetical protein LRM64_10130 [Prescottella equi]|uniref:hypothetical protein n=1 Tax=Rhodococcus hoagii TaxID=43767 RepID=UPI0019EDB9D8|nr:hypothetical protein [Prescottella equi]MBM4592254.1 hypothetical protein [Prescottella equi]MCU7531904.1 hypothetical protein [Prescottella equi]MCU7534036.1 hypothetical protein [Prescottella equi]NKW13285.1 hypothetical protein [Prescottella equi]NKW17054.1 hypothetical protein [Prescottella equi]
MSELEEAAKQIVIGANHLTIGGELVPGLIGDVVTVKEGSGIPGFHEVSVTFLTDVMPTSAPGLVDEPINTRIIRPALPGDD